MTMTPVQPPPPQFNRRPPQKKRPRLPMLWVAVLSGILCAFLLFVGYQLSHLVQEGKAGISLPNPFPIFHGSLGQKVILVMGVDAPNSAVRAKDENSFSGTRTDTMMLVRVDAEKKRASVVSIPRDSKVYISGDHGIDKINAAHAIGGPDLAVQTVQDSFGIPVDNYLVINFRGVRQLVDAIGGIDVYVEKPMHYTDNTAKLFINFEPGVHHLDGRQAESFLRFRHDQLGDIGRIRRQQQFVVAVSKRLRDPSIIFKIPELVKLANQYVMTDMTPDQLVALAFFGKDVNMTRIRTATLPGHPGGIRVSYWMVDPDAAQTVLDRLILDNTTPQPGMSVSDPNAPARIGIFYDPAMADQLPAFVNALEQKNFKVVCKDGQRRSSTQIIEHTTRITDEMTDAVRAADARLTNARLIFAPVGTTFENNACSVGEDYTLILGADSNHS